MGHPPEDQMTETCSAENCERDVWCKGLCQMHYNRMRVHGTTEIPQKPSFQYGARWATWKGVRKRHPEGVGWSSFKEFSASVGDRPGYSFIVVKRDESLPIGPDNFQWKLRDGGVGQGRRGGTFDLRTKDGRKEYDDHLKRTRPDRVTSTNLKKQYGIDIEQYRDMLVAQEGVCAICKRPERLIKGGKLVSLSVDHDHNGGGVRGLLCNTCNRGLGMFEDNPDFLTSAVAYLSANRQSAGNVIPFRKEA